MATDSLYSTIVTKVRDLIVGSRSPEFPRRISS